jgi:hypothetical protein
LCCVSTQVVLDGARIVGAELDQHPAVLDQAQQLVDRVDDLEADLLLGDDQLGTLRLLPETGLGHLVFDVG